MRVSPVFFVMGFWGDFLRGSWGISLWFPPGFLGVFVGVSLGVSAVFSLWYLGVFSCVFVVHVFCVFFFVIWFGVWVVFGGCSEGC